MSSSSSVESLTIKFKFKNMMFMGRIASSKASHKNLQEHLLISRASRVLPMEQNLVRQASEMPLYKIGEIADI